MSRRILLAAFRQEEDLLNAVRAVRAGGGTIVDVYSPYAVHGLSELLDWRPSRLTWACGLCGAAGALFMLWFQFWTSAVNWPLNVGGKPFQSLPAFVPVIFEAMVLCGAFGTVLAFFLVARLRPGKQVSLIRERVTDDRFALLVEQTDAAFDVQQMSALLAECRAEQIEERELAVRPTVSGETSESSGLRWLNAALLVGFAAAVLAVLFTPRDLARPNFEYMPTMRRSVPLDSQTARSSLLAAGPLAGTIARDAQPMHYQATEDDAQRAALELNSPLQPADAGALERGRYVFLNFCVSCHGPSGEGDGPMALRGYPPPPALSAEKSRLLKDGELFHVVSYGRRFMPPHRNQLSQLDRWKVIAYIRELQSREKSGPQAEDGTGGEPESESTSDEEAR